MRRILCTALLGLLLVVPVADAQQPDRVIRAGAEGVRSIGAFKTTPNGRRPYATLRQAIRVFGRPSSRRHVNGRTGCVARWRRVGLRIEFENFGGIPRGRTACMPRYGLAQTVHVTGSGWITDRGLAIGAPADQIAALYPEAEQQPDGSWWLIVGLSPIGDCDVPAGCPYAILAATAGSGFVEAFDLSIGAAGD